MSNLVIIPGEGATDERTADSIKYNKDCYDFQNLEDGTIIGECKYCNFSLVCRQIDININSKVIPMESHYLPVVDASGEVVSHELFCTGMYDLRPRKERLEDDKVS